MTPSVHDPNRRPAEIILDLIADMPNYGRWLPGSEAFVGQRRFRPIRSVSAQPSQRGTAKWVRQPK